MIKNIFRFTLVLVVFSMFSCDDEDAGVPGNYAIFGEREVSPETNGTYSLHVEGVEAAWTSSDPTIMNIISTNPSTVEVAFLKSGTVRLTGTDGVRTGVVDITVASGSTGVAYTYSGTGRLKSGDSDTVFVTFEAPLEGIPTMIVNEDFSGFVTDSGGEKAMAFVSPGASLSAFSSYQGSDKVFYARYTAGSGDGQPEAFINSITVNETYGGVVRDSIYVNLPAVDNFAPYGRVTFSENVVNDNSMVRITVRFNEAVIPNYDYSPSSSVLIHISGAGVQDVVDTLQATADPQIWLLDYMTNGQGNGAMAATVDPVSVMDLAGNTAIVASAVLEIDNTAPNPILTNAFEVDVIDVVVTVTLSGDDEVRWMYLEGGSTAPQVSDFGAALSQGDVFTLVEGVYDFYYIAIDKAGNVSDIESELGIVVPSP